LVVQVHESAVVVVVVVVNYEYLVVVVDLRVDERLEPKVVELVVDQAMAIEIFVAVVESFVTAAAIVVEESFLAVEFVGAGLDFLVFPLHLENASSMKLICVIIGNKNPLKGLRVQTEKRIYFCVKSISLRGGKIDKKRAMKATKRV
jgi:hypothetical protein